MNITSAGNEIILLINYSKYNTINFEFLYILHMRFASHLHDTFKIALEFGKVF